VYVTLSVEMATEDRSEFVRLTRRFARERFGDRALELANTHEYPRWVFDELAQAGYFGLYRAEEWGGLHVGLQTLCDVIESLAFVSNTVASMVIGQLQGSLPILITGDDQIRARYLPGIFAGRILPSMALTEPDAGSDVAGIRSLARDDGDHFVLNGRKAFITHAALADVITVYVKLENGRSTSSIQGFLIPAGTPGMIVGRTEEKMGSTALPTSELILDECRVPKAWRLGEPGSGFRSAMQVLERVRVAVAARSVGVAAGALAEAVDYMRERQTFGVPLADHQALSFMVADMATQIEAARGLVRRACEAVDSDDPELGRYCAMAKLYATDVAMRVTTDAVQLFGGYGYMKDYPVEHRMREAKLAQIVDGTNQIQRLIIGRSVLSGPRNDS
jgi:alkylation response protein AidB-like acyl-CoA dehydrogenase